MPSSQAISISSAQISPGRPRPISRNRSDPARWRSGRPAPQGIKNPIYFQQTYDLRKIRIEDYAKRGEDISNSMPPGGQGMDRTNPRVALLMEQQKRMILSMGQMLGEEVLHVARFASERPVTDAEIAGAQNDSDLPGAQADGHGQGRFSG